MKSRSAGGEYVGSLKLPETNLTSIAQCAFGWCTSLTNVVPFLPDSVTSVSPAAFYNSPIAGDLFLRGVVGMQTDTIFLGTKITSMTFGPDLEEFEKPRPQVSNVKRRDDAHEHRIRRCMFQREHRIVRL
ncbi:MAG: leucine-rich repeat protein [Kiritimatiellia bacterium]